MRRIVFYFISTFSLIISGCAYGTPYQGGAFDQDPISSKNMYKATMTPYVVKGIKYYPIAPRVGDVYTGTASWYGPNFHGNQTSNGEYYNMYQRTAAHKTLPINTMLEVSNLQTGASTIVRINDRGPFVAGRIIDLSYQAAMDIGLVENGTGHVRLKVLDYDTTARDYLHEKEQIVQAPKPQTTMQALVIEDTKKDITPKYHVQISSTSRKDRAIELANKYALIDGLYRVSVKEKKANGVPLYKIVVGIFNDASSAKSFITSHKQFNGAFVIKD